MGSEEITEIIMDLFDLKVKYIKILILVSIVAFFLVIAFNIYQGLMTLAYAEIVFLFILLFAVFNLEKRYKLSVYMIYLYSLFLMALVIHVQVIQNKWQLAVWMPVYVLAMAIITDPKGGVLSGIFVILVSAIFIYRMGKIDDPVLFFYLVQLAIAIILVSIFYFAFYEMWRKYGELLKERADFDALTGALSRRKILELIDLEIERVKRGGKSFSILMLDLDGFKRINDEMGHLYGDKVLKEVVTAIRSVIRKSDYCGRFGGDEFLVLLPLTDVEGAKVLACRILSEIKKVGIGASVGIAEYKDGLTAMELISQADKALYCAKSSQQDKVVVFSTAKPV